MVKPQLYLINGPLGAGKTTFLKELLKKPQFVEARIIENEFASISIDTSQLHDHHAEVQTITGVCICCSTGDELADALNELAGVSAPVIIEATGVANSLKLIEKLVVADILDRYDIAQAFFILDGAAAAADLARTIMVYRDELRAADTVLVSKTDLLSTDDRDQLIGRLHNENVHHIHTMIEGKIDDDISNLQPSTIVDHFSRFDGEMIDHDDANYTVIDLAAQPVDMSRLSSVWHNLQKTYGLRRMKGDLISDDETIWHIEATLQQCRITPSTSTIIKLVLIGQKARLITKATILDEMSKL